ncbi:trichohyalin isoform X1 [Drosophila suzukii]|uniref:Trichohyalin isoform X1 n=1 Tax=Drosophila suzukii TaxID=28584 RepID=A0AB40A2S7_DROSZ
MVVSESEPEFLSESEPEPMSEHQAAIDGNLENSLSTSTHEGEVDLNAECDVYRKDTNQKADNQDDIAEPKDLDESQPDIKSPTKEDTTRPLVLEERHSLSIAETKKRRASVYSNELLFIPKELARSELQQRTRTLSRYAKNREYHLRMLKFPVGSGRPRYVAKQMKKDRDDNHPISQETDNEFETNEYPVDIKEEEFAEEPSEEIQDLGEQPLNMPDLSAECEVKTQLPDDEEISVMLFDLVKQEVETNDSSEEENRKILQSQRESVIRTSSTRRQHYPYLCWHNPQREDLHFKMEPMTQWETKSEPEIQDGYDDTNNLENAEDAVEDLAVPDQVEQSSEVETEQPETISYLYDPAQNQLTTEIQLELQVAEEVPANNFNPQPATSVSLEDSDQTANSLLRQQLIHHIVQPNLCNEEIYQSINCNNNAVDRVNQNLRHQFVGPTVASDPSPQWNPPNQSFHKQQLHIQQQYMQQQLHQSSSQQQQEVIYQQHQHEAEDKLQQMRVMYQRIKCREEEQLHQLGKSLKKLLDDRMSCERHHAEEKRLFMLKMEQFKKVEEKLKSDRDQIKRQLRSDLRTLELRIADQQRQQEEKALAWSWQQQQQQQRQQFLVQQQSQQQQQLQQQHFMHHPHSQETHPANQEPYMQHSFLYDPPPYLYPTAYQESLVYQQRIQAYHDHQQNYNAAESQTTAIELQRRLLLPPPPYCQSSNRTSTEVSPTSRKVRHRPTADQRSDPYPRAQLRGPLPPAAEIMQLQRYPRMSPPVAQVHEPRNEPYGLTSVMTNYVANFMNMRNER